MKIRQAHQGRERRYELELDRKDVDTLLDSESQGVISPHARDGTQFWLFPHPTTFEDSFRLHPDGDNIYYIYIGGLEIRENIHLAKALDERGRIPIKIENPLTHPSRNPSLNVGYVYIKVDWLTSPSYRSTKTI